MVLIPKREPAVPIDLSTYVLTFGKYKGTSFKELYKNDPGYVLWMARENAGKLNLPLKLVGGVKVLDREAIIELMGSPYPIEPDPAKNNIEPVFTPTFKNPIDPLADFSWVSFP